MDNQTPPMIAYSPTRERALLARPDLQPARYAFAAYVKANEAWADLYQACADQLKARGLDAGPLVSGCGSDRFTPAQRDALRALRAAGTAALDTAMAMRPPRVRLATLRELKGYVRSRAQRGEV